MNNSCETCKSIVESKQSRRAFLSNAGHFMLFATGLGLFASSGARSLAASAWGYHGAGAPSAWGELRPEYAVCGTGERQSPVNIAGAEPAGSADILAFDYHESRLNMTHTGHDLRIDYDPGSRIFFQNEAYHLLQFHFHTPGEHRVHGNEFPMEMHLVHRHVLGDLAVVGVTLTQGRENPFLAQFWPHMPTQPSEVQLDRRIHVAEMLPTSRSFYNYDGSLTTPPCSENVSWIVLKESVEVSKEQVDRHVALFNRNARPVQPVGSRLVREYR